ncbi:MAG TPA: hypothetical protein VKJ65_07450 [Phycisphaerae bacterium]|nr:hypothetical protein [Phycisphaerae bacterium]
MKLSKKTKWVLAFLFGIPCAIILIFHIYNDHLVVADHEIDDWLQGNVQKQISQVEIDDENGNTIANLDDADIKYLQHSFSKPLVDPETPDSGEIYLKIQFQDGSSAKLQTSVLSDRLIVQSPVWDHKLFPIDPPPTYGIDITNPMPEQLAKIVSEYAPKQQIWNWDVGQLKGELLHIGEIGYYADEQAWVINPDSGQIGGTSDQFHFMFHTFSGDGMFEAHLRSLEMDSAGPLALAGVMLRTSRAANAPFIMVFQNLDKQLGLMWRTTTGGSAATSGLVNNTATTHWLRIQRTGDWFRGYYTDDGETWIQIGRSVKIQMDKNVLAGLTATINTDTQMVTAKFDRVSSTSGWDDPGN